MKPALFIDFDGTICFDRFLVDVPDLVITWINAHIFQNPSLMIDWIMGIKTSEQVIQYIANGTHHDYDTLWSLFVKSCKNMFVDPVILQSVKSLSESYTTILITDNMDSFRRFTMPVLKLDQYFDFIEVSTDYGLLKNNTSDGAFFKQVAEKCNVSLKDSFFIDNGQKNCQVFEELGGTSFLTTGLKDTMSILTKMDKLKGKII
ncbi:MAG: HAD family hydrolase [Alphaproteobacteria bacterium]|nr:HAD family hydrolase [Alphaproteobacteria bacterium]